MNDDLDLEQRLRQLGDTPIDPATAQAHRTAMATAAARPSRRFGWKAVAAAAVAGFLAGSTGLAAAGALPDPAQDVAHDVLDVVGIGVPRSTEGCPEGTTYRNHGEYVSSVEAAGGDVEAAAKSSCGKPDHGAAKGKGKGKGGAAKKDADGDPCTGPPPWAGTHMSPEDKAAAVAERQATCGTEEDDEAEEPEDDRAEVEEDADLEEEPKAPAEVDETTTTTEAEQETTTTTEAETTTTTGS